MSLREHELITGLQLVKKDTFDFLFRSYYSGLCPDANNYLKPSDKSEEIVQEVFLRIWERQRNKTIEQIMELIKISTNVEYGIDGREIWLSKTGKQIKNDH
jgi:hypothetical protein